MACTHWGENRRNEVAGWLEQKKLGQRPVPYTPQDNDVDRGRTQEISVLYIIGGRTIIWMACTYIHTSSPLLGLRGGLLAFGQLGRCRRSL